MKILIAPLDWGLGHTTRCIPIIQYLKTRGHEVYAAAETGSAKLLQENFPDLKILPLQGYRIQYSKKKAFFSIKLLLQIPKILKAVKSEHEWLIDIQMEHHFDFIISDNRYGLHHPEVPSVIMTHQLQIQSGIASWMDHVIRKMHYKWLNKFRQCWIVDEKEGFSGKLAHPKIIPENARYMGILSQFSNREIDRGSSVDNRILILLSGPEPMRSILERKLLHQAKDLVQYQFVVVGGNPLGETVTVLNSNMQYHTHLNAERLLKELKQASLVICRSGYSTIMDLLLLQKKGLLIPTPGQSEQEYLAKYLADKSIFYKVCEGGLDLRRDISKALLFSNVKQTPVPFEENMAQILSSF